MSPQTAELGLYWKNMWYLLRQKIGPLGSFIQFLAGRRWNWGRRGSEERFFSAARSFDGSSAAIAARAVEDFRKWRRLGMMARSVMEMMLQENEEKDNAETRRAQRGAEDL